MCAWASLTASSDRNRSGKVGPITKRFEPSEKCSEYFPWIPSAKMYSWAHLQIGPVSLFTRSTLSLVASLALTSAFLTRHLLLLVIRQARPQARAPSSRYCNSLTSRMDIEVIVSSMRQISPEAAQTPRRAHGRVGGRRVDRRVQCSGLEAKARDSSSPLRICRHTFAPFCRAWISQFGSGWTYG